MRHTLLFIILAFATARLGATETESAANDVVAADSLRVSAIAANGAIAADSAMAFQRAGRVELQRAAAQSSTLFVKSDFRPTIYDYPYSRTRSVPNWKHLWINTSVLVGAGITTMFVLEALPEESTAWNKRSNTSMPLFKRWWKHVKEGPVWDGDNPVFNYVLHPYAGAAYYMGARSCGFNCLGSFIYSFCISTFFWEYGFESFNEIPSVQDLIITPFVGSILGEGFYLVKRHIVSHGYRLFGSRVLGYIVAFLVDPLNECIGYFRGDQRKKHFAVGERSVVKTSSWIGSSKFGLQAGVTVKYMF